MLLLILISINSKRMVGVGRRLLLKLLSHGLDLTFCGFIITIFEINKAKNSDTPKGWEGATIIKRKRCEGVHGAVAKATGWSAPTQGSYPGRRTFMLRGLSLEFSYQKNKEKKIYLQK